MSEYELLLKKSQILLTEAIKDEKIGCYNKCISSLWFAIENLLKAIILRRKGSYPKKIGKLIAIMVQEIKSLNGDKIIIKYLRELYSDRKDIDHGLLIISKKRCREDLKKGEYVVKFLTDMFNIELPK